jgi:general secretion pathway protein I
MKMHVVERAGFAVRRRGFTLIEVLAALVIVALGMLGVIEAVTQTARNGTYLRDKTLAHWIAMNLITEQRLQSSPPEVTKSSDEVEFAGQRWRWTMVVTQTQVDSLRRMDVAVRRAEAPEDSSLTTVTGFYGTAIGAAGGGTVDWVGTQSGGPSDDDDDAGDAPPADSSTDDPQPNPEPPEEDE